MANVFVLIEDTHGLFCYLIQVYILDKKPTNNNNNKLHAGAPHFAFF